MLYILSLEALINRALEHFLPEPQRQFFVDGEERFSLEDKWQLLPLLAGEGNASTFDKTYQIWARFIELIKVRNEYVHPKHDRPAYYEAVTAVQLRPLAWNEIPEGLRAKEKDIVCRQTQIPRDPYTLRVEHADSARGAVDDVIGELDRMLGGRITAGNWHKTDGMGLIWPPGATFSDLPNASAV